MAIIYKFFKRRKEKMVSKKVLKNIGVFALTVVLAAAPVAGASATNGGQTTRAAQGESTDSTDKPENPVTPDKPSTTPTSSSSGKHSGGSGGGSGTSYSAPNVTASDGTVMNSTIGGEYAVSGLTGTAIVTPKSAVAAALNAPAGASITVRVVDTKCGPNAKKSIQDGMAALALAGIPATEVTAIDIYAFVNGESVIHAATPVTAQFGVPVSMRDGSQIAAILVQEGGVVTLLKDLDVDPATVTLELPGFGVLALVKVPAGSM